MDRLSEGEKYYCSTKRGLPHSGQRIVAKENLPRVQSFEQLTWLLILPGRRDGLRQRYTLKKRVYMLWLTICSDVQRMRGNTFGKSVMRKSGEDECG